MAIGRTEFQFSVSGVESTTRSLQNVAAAETAVAAQADAASRKVMAMDAAAAALGVNLDSTGRVMQSATKATGALGKSLEVAGSGLAFLSRAAAILPGFGIAGLLLAIAEGGQALYKAMTGVSSATADANREIQYQAALAREHTAYMEKQAAAARDLARSMTEVGEAFLSAQSGISSGAGGGGYLLGAMFGGEVEDIKAAKVELRERAGALKKQREDLMRDFQNAAVEYEGTRAAPAIRAALDARLRAIQAEANEIRRQGNFIRDREVDLMRAAKGALGSADKSTGGARGGAVVDTSLGATVGRIAAEQTPLRAMESGALAGIGGMAGESYDASAEAARARAQEMADFQIAQDQRNAMMIAHMQGVQSEAANTANAMDMLAGSFDGAFARMVSSATDAGGMLTQALSVITGAVGSMMTNIIISGNAGSKGVAKAAGNALAGLSAQAFGYGVLLEGLALAAALVPGLGFSAPSIAAAGGIMFGVGAALGVTARALGADKLGAGGKSSAGASAGGGGGGSSAAVGTGGGGGRGEAPVYVSVQIGEEPVAAIMRRSNEREARRGGMNGHFAMGAA
jgi:hypothetical protein